MTKKKSIVKLCVISVLTLIGLFLTFFSFVIPTTNTTFKGFFNAINYGYDIDGGVLAVYKPYDDTLAGHDLENKVNSTVANLESALSGWGFSVTQQGDNVRIEISETDYKSVNTKLGTYGVDILSLIGTSEGITFSDDATDGKAEGYVSGEYIEKCTFGYNQADYVEIVFTEEGKAKFKKLTQKVVDSGAAENKIYMFINGENYNSSGFEIESAISGLTLTATNAQAAQALSLQISVLAKPMLLTQVVNNTISAGLNTSTGSFFGNQQVLLICGLVTLLIASFAFLCVRYRVLGALACLANIIFVIIYSFLLQSIPLVTMDMNGIVGVVFTYLVLFAGTITIFEKIRQEYQSGKKIPNSVTSGFKKNVLPTLERYVFVLILAAVFFIVGTPALKAIAVNAFVGLFVNYFTLFVVLSGLCKTYLPINSTNKKLYNLKREAVKHEI